MNKSIKAISMFALNLALLFVIYSFIPRVFHNEQVFGKALPNVEILPNTLQAEVRSFIRDTANNMQVVMALHKGNVIFEEGDTKRLINSHSARKSIMSLLIGIAQDKGFLRLEETLAEIGIDESKTPLTATEKSATIRDLLRCTSSIFLASEAEHDWADSRRPKRGQYVPGTYFFYNNFDFNILGAILEIKSGMSIGAFMTKYLAEPLQMQDFSEKCVVYNSPWPVAKKTASDYPVFWIYLSARDFAKIGVLINNKGKWNKQEVVSAAWVAESLETQFELPEEQSNFYSPYDAFAYSWWIDKDTNTTWADGYGGQFLCIDKANDLIVLQRNFTGNSLLSSGLFLMNEDRDNNPKSDLLHVYKRIKNHVGLTTK